MFSQQSQMCDDLFISSSSKFFFLLYKSTLLPFGHKREMLMQYVHGTKKYNFCQTLAEFNPFH